MKTIAPESVTPCSKGSQPHGVAPIENQPAPGKDSRHPLDYLRVYLITDRTLFPEKDFLRAVESALKGGVRALQLREKDLAPSALWSLAREVRALTRQHGAKLFINDRSDIAEMVGAEGVHLTETSIPTEAVRKRFPHLVIGVSTHSIEGARRAEDQGADFITFGPVFKTPSKTVYGPPQGLDRLREVTRKVRLPVLALGGIRRERIPSVMDQGAFGVAMISAIWKSPDIQKEAFEYTQFFPGEN